MNDPDIRPQSILVYVGLDLMGDGLMKLPFVRVLRQTFPDARVTWLAGKGPSAYAGKLAPMIEDLIDEIVDDAGIGSHWHELLGRAAGPGRLAGRRFDLIIDTQRRVLTTLILRRIPHRWFVSGAAGYWLSSRRLRRGYRKPPSMIGQMFDLVSTAAGRSTAVADLVKVPLRLPAYMVEAATRLLPSQDGGGTVYVGLSPGAGGRQKCWPLDNFIALACIQITQNRIPVFVLGIDESDWIDRLRQSVPTALFPVQSETYADFAYDPLFTIALAKRLAVSVANDSGIGHMLAAADQPLITLFGPTPAEKFAPTTPDLTLLSSGDFAPGSKDMASIPVDAVAAAIDRVLER